MGIEPSASELKKSFRLHGKVAKQGNEASHFLLLFYSVECGLKALAFDELFKGKPPKYNEYNKWIHGFGHDLDKLIKELRMPGKYKPPSGFFLRRISTECGLSKCHEAWRYGVEMKAEDQTEIVNWLKKISDEYILER